MNQPDNMTLKATLEKREQAREDGEAWQTSDWFAWMARLTLLAALLMAPWWYGSVGHRPQFWLTIALLVGLGFWWFETALHRRRRQVLPYVLVPLLLGALLGIVQLTPLPAWGQDWLLGRQPEIYQQFAVDGARLLDGTAAESGVPIRATLNQEGTWIHLRLLFFGIAGMLLGARMFRRRSSLLALLTVLSCLGVVLSLFGLFQKITADPQTIYWVIPLTQGGRPFGPWVNGNNAAGFLLMCLAAAIGLMIMLMGERRNAGPVPLISREMPLWRQLYFSLLYFVSELTATKLASLFAVVVITVGVLSSLSRGGVLALLVASVVTLVAYGIARRPKQGSLILIPLFLLVLGLFSWVGFGDELLSRFERTSVDLEEALTTDKRLKNWQDTWPAVGEMGWLGSGLGSYENLHRLYRSDREDQIFVYAENQYFQALVEAGWPGLALFCLAWLLAGMGGVILLSKGKSATTIAVGTLAVFLLASQAVAAFFDFGMYIPSNTLLMSVLVGVTAYHAHALAGRLKAKSWFRWQSPNWVIQAVLLMVFAATTLAVLDLNRRRQIEPIVDLDVATADFRELDLEATDKAIDQLRPLLDRSVSVAGWNTLAELWLHRGRLELWETLRADLPALPSAEDERGRQLDDRLWLLTGLSRIHEHVKWLKRRSEWEAARFLQRDFLEGYLDSARRFYSVSRLASPLQPEIQLQIGKINAVLGRPEVALVDLERAVDLAPGNAGIRLFAGILLVQEQRWSEAAPILKVAMDLQPSLFNDIMEFLLGRSERQIVPVPPELILDEFLPPQPKLLHRFAMAYCDDESDLQTRALRRTEMLLSEIAVADTESQLLLAIVREKLDDGAGAIEPLRNVLFLRPSDHVTRAKLVRLLCAEGQGRLARQEFDDISSKSLNPEAYSRLKNLVIAAEKAEDDKKAELERTTQSKVDSDTEAEKESSENMTEERD